MGKVDQELNEIIEACKLFIVVKLGTGKFTTMLTNLPWAEILNDWEQLYSSFSNAYIIEPETLDELEEMIDKLQNSHELEGTPHHIEPILSLRKLNYLGTTDRFEKLVLRFLNLRGKQKIAVTLGSEVMFRGLQACIVHKTSERM